MLSKIDANPIIAVSDLARARRFYGETLGLEATSEDDQMSVYRTGSTRLTVYVSDYAGTNRANAVVWGFDQGLEDEVKRLRDAGVAFEHYADMPGGFADGVHAMGDARMAWFKDPDGNILHLVQGM